MACRIGIRGVLAMAVALVVVPVGHVALAAGAHI
jgi:hypothetical protein